MELGDFSLVGGGGGAAAAKGRAFKIPKNQYW